MSKPKAAPFSAATDDVSARFSIAKRLTQPMHKFVPGIPSVVRIQSEITDGSVLKGRGDKSHSVPVKVCTVLNIRTDAIESMIVPPEILTAFGLTYRADMQMSSYIGRYFQITKRDRKTGASGVTYTCEELELRNHD